MSTNANVLIRREDTAAVQEGDAFLVVLERAARDPSVDIAKMQQILEMKERIDAQAAKVAFTEAMNRVQAKVPRIVKGRKIVVKGTLRSKYAALEDIDAALRPITTQEGFSLSYSTEDIPPKATRLILTVKHRQGHEEQFSLVLPIEKTEFRSAAQDAAATITFGKRQLKCMAFDIITVDEDRDGNPTGDFINENQVLTIADMLKDRGLSESDAKFLAWCGVDKIEHIQAAAYQRTVQALVAKGSGK